MNSSSVTITATVASTKHFFSPHSPISMHFPSILTVAAAAMAVAIVPAAAQITANLNLTSPTLNLTVIHNTEAAGIACMRLPVQDANNGLLYLVGSCGSNAAGAIATLNATSQAFTPISSLPSDSTVNFPYGMTQHTNGNYYGTLIEATTNGVMTAPGAIFTLSNSTNQFTKLTSLTTTICTPRGYLLQSMNSTLMYGAGVGDPNSILSNSNPYGSLFSVTTAGILTPIYMFGGGIVSSTSTDGRSPIVLIQSTQVTNVNNYAQTLVVNSANNKLFGATAYNTDNLPSVLFVINTDGSNFQVLRNMATAADGNSVQLMVLASSGIVYGTNQIGGPNGGGTLFSFSSAATGSSDAQFTIVYAFTSGGLGANSCTRFIQGLDGMLYGVCSQGGPTNGGVVWSAAVPTPIQYVAAPSNQTGNVTAPITPVVPVVASSAISPLYALMTLLVLPLGAIAYTLHLQLQKQRCPEQHIVTDEKMDSPCVKYEELSDAAHVQQLPIASANTTTATSALQPELVHFSSSLFEQECV